MTDSSLGRAVREVLERHRWLLRRRRRRFIVLRAGESRGFCEFSWDEPRGAGRSLTPGRLRAAPGLGGPPAAAEKEGLSELQGALGRWLESLRAGQAAGAPAEALAEVHEGAEGQDILLRTTFACNQACPFCFVPLTGRAAGLSEIERELDFQARRAGPRAELTISGGEPASDPRLPKILAAARSRGFKRFVLQTNAVYLARPGLVETLAGLGVRTYLVSFHAHRSRAYDKITGSKGQYSRAVEGLKRLLAAKGLNVTVNVVVNVHNYRHLPSLVDLLARLAPSVPGMYFSMINEAGHQKAPAWAVALERAAPYLRRALELCRLSGVAVSRFGGESAFPVCLLEEPGRFAGRRALPQDRVRYGEDFMGEAAVGRAKRLACRTCRYDARCSGVSASYARLFGLKALRPVTAGGSHA